MGRAAAFTTFTVAATLAIGGGVTPLAHALVGPASDDSAAGAHTVMVLKRSARGAGFCSGVVITASIVLTAGHCVARPEDIRVHFPDGSGKPTLRAISAISVHPQYRANAARTRERSIDLALMRLAEPLPGNFRPVSFETAATIGVGARFRIAGYGVAREGVGASGGVLRSGVLAARAPLSSILLWAEDPQQKGLGACEGDSGGPIFSEETGKLAAITSWAEGPNGRGCGKLTQAALIAPQRAWIESVLRSWGAR